jgi:predicted DNA-binding transcriptional regulator AlpA
VHARNGPCNDQALYFRSPFENCVGTRVAHKSPGQGFFPNWADPRMMNVDAFVGSSTRFCTQFMGRERAQVRLADSIQVVSNTTSDIPASPPEGRLWTVNDLVLYFSVKTIGDLIKRHPDFPSPLPLRTRDRRWRPCDVIAWTNNLVLNPENAEMRNTIPEFDISTIADLLREA